MSPCDHRDLLRPMLLALAVVFAGVLSAKEKEPPSPPPIRALLVTGGSSHEYQVRQEILTKGIRERVVRPIEWVVRIQGVGESDVRIPLFESAEWAKDYDIVVHDHCFPRVRDTAYVDRVLAPHRAGLPAVLLHGSMMSFRTGDERWFDFTGLTTRAHERERAVKVEALAPGDPIMNGFLPWEIPREELYRVEQVKSGAVALTRSLDPAGQSHTTTWTHRFGPAQARVFGTTLGNATATVADTRYLDLITRGFLWSLGELSETSFRVVPASESLKGFVLEIPAIPLPKPGRNAVREGETSAFSWGSTAAPEEIALTNDGDPATSWSATAPGPGSWEVSWRDPRMIGAVVVYWKGAAPREARLEGTSDGRTWRLLASLGPSEEAHTPVLVQIPPSKYRGLRVSVDAMPPGGRIGLREVAAYGIEASVPSAILAMQPAKTASPALRPAGNSAFLSRIHLAPGWKVAREGIVPVGGEIGQLVPTASGAVFLSVFPEPGASGAVYRALPEGESGFVIQTYLAKIDSGTRIAWDGEWLYTLSGARLERVRRALGNEPADERQRFEALYTLPGEEAPREAEIRDLEFGPDGWLWARVSSEEAGIVVSREGRRVVWPLDGMIRFSPLGRRLTSERPKPRAPIEVLPGGGRVEGLLARADDGDVIRLIGTVAGKKHLAALVLNPDALEPSPDWNEINTSELAGLLSGSLDHLSHTGRLEAALESRRRKGEVAVQFRSEIPGREIPGELAPYLVTAAADLPNSSSFDRIEGMTAHADPEVQAAAYGALGDHPQAWLSQQFTELGSITIPAVSAAIFDALRRSEAPLPGAETVAMSLANHEDPRLSAAAHDFLVDRGAVAIALQTLDHEDEAYWPAAFSLLGALPTEPVVRNLMGRLDQTRDPAFRRSGLETLGDLFPARSKGPARWSESDRIERYLFSQLTDHRVDRVALIETMKKVGLQVTAPDHFVQLGKEDQRLEAFALDGLIRSEATWLPEGALPWLRLLSSDESRDPALRRRALALLARHAPANDYRLTFGEIARALSADSDSDSANLLRSFWMGRGDHAANRDWLDGQTTRRDPRGRGLAWSSLVAGLPIDGEVNDVSTRFATALAAAIQADGEDSHKFVTEIRAAPVGIVKRFLGIINATPDPAIMAISGSLAAALSPHPDGVDPAIPRIGVNPDVLASLVDSGDSQLAAGAATFRILGCIDCHNPHGEGASYGPDLTVAGRWHSLTELINAIVSPGTDAAPGDQVKSLDLPNGRRGLAWGERRMERASEWIDLAGNRLDLNSGESAGPAGDSSETACRRAIPLSQVEWIDLVVFMRSLAN